ncbi:MAG: class I SAM-dependent methyltransferase [Deltaproteobacteria bacterium]|nr:MAG: class I SAM-dependent methyltransferase [Deltaproteobacteria bacterium]
MRLFKRNRKDHWERVYQKLSPAEVGWYQAHPETSLKLINNTGAGTDSGIIDVGGGTSKLSGLLLDQGYKKLAVLDISGTSIEKAKSQLGEKSNRIIWIEADVTKYSFMEQYDVWHDRAVFHFLTEAEDRKAYINSLNQALKLNGHLIIATFGLDAPPKCSGLSVVRYSPETLHNELGDNFNLVEAFVEDHVTPSGVKQNFIFCRFIKRA